MHFTPAGAPNGLSLIQLGAPSLSSMVPPAIATLPQHQQANELTHEAKNPRANRLTNYKTQMNLTQ